MYNVSSTDEPGAGCFPHVTTIDDGEDSSSSVEEFVDSCEECDETDDSSSQPSSMYKYYMHYVNFKAHCFMTTGFSEATLLHQFV